MSQRETITCFLVEREENQITQRMTQQPVGALPPGDVLIEVRYSALNYKDALAASGHPGVALATPLVPGIDAVGTVVESSVNLYSAGDKVMVSGADFGTRSWGGWSTLARVPADYCLPLPGEMTLREAAIIGTAGFTAAQSLEKLQHHGVRPEDGPVLVTGATGGVGIFAVRLLAQNNYHVVASTGKQDRHGWLKENGASEVISREEVTDETNRPLLSSKWAGGIDSVGGNTLTSLLRATNPRGCVTACGLVSGDKISMTVFPFILRGISLQGIDSANASVEYRHQLWKRLATDWKIRDVESLATETSLADLKESVTRILAGKVAGRCVVSVRSGQHS